MNTMFVITLVYSIALSLIGIVLLFYKPRKEDEKRKKQIMLIRHNLNLKDKIDIINGKNSHKNNRLKNYFLDVEIILAKMNKIDEYPKIKIYSILFSLLGIVIGAILNNYLLCLITVPLFAMIPFQLVKYRYNKYNKQLEEELETAISLISISYNQTTNFITSVEKCVDTLPPKAKVYFQDFLMEVKNLNANIDSALVNLKTKVENRVFQQWIDRVIICQRDKSAISSLQSIATEYSVNRNIQNELVAEAYEAKFELYIMLFVVAFTPVLLYFLQKDAFIHLVNDLPGKITMFVSLLVCIVVYFIGNKIAKPIVFRGNRE